MKIKPIITEKSLKEAALGNYTFLVGPALTKWQIKRVISEMFNVHVTRVRTINRPQSVRKNHLGRKVTSGGFKKAMVTLKDKEKIDLFETKKGKDK